MRCSACAADNADYNETCKRCGRPLVRICQICRSEIPVGFRFCGHCGAPQPELSTDNQANPDLPSREGARGGERRQLTILFCDLIGSTLLAERLDPEILRDIMRRYQNTCSNIIAQFGGEVASISGDGILCYFGYPIAYEDAAERAVRAGIGITSTFRRRRDRVNLEVRIGISTGLVVVGELIEAAGVREHELIGSTINLAARLQKLAKSNSIIIGTQTRDIIGDLFFYENIGEHRLEGFSEPIQAFAVMAENLGADRFEARNRASLLPIANRERERALLEERWCKAKSGFGQVVLMSGEPGIGKSRLVRYLRDYLKDERHEQIAFSGSPLHQHTPLYPVVHWIRQASGIGSNDTAGQRLAKVETFIDTKNAGSVDALIPVVELIGASLDRVPLTQKDSPKKDMEKLLEAILTFLEAFALRQPLLMILEDVQWIDPSSHELLRRIIDRTSELPLLVLITFRSDYERSWPERPYLTHVLIGPLDQNSCNDLISSVANRIYLPSQVSKNIIAKTDGIPLFIEELTRTIIESSEEPADVAVPETLRDTLSARLGRNPAARSIAQVAAAIGRVFSFEILAKIVKQPVRELRLALDELQDIGLIYQHGALAHETYTFKHALVQETAYETQLLQRRRTIHQQIADALRVYFPETPSEVLAHHYEKAEAISEAIAHYRRAAEIGRNQAASAESAAHFGKALQLLDMLPASQERNRSEFDLQVAYGAQLIAVKGNAADEVGLAYRRAMVLSTKIGDRRKTYRVLRGLQTFYMVRGQLTKARPIGRRLVAEAEEFEDVGTRLQAHRPHGLCLCYMGDFADARFHLETALSLYDPTAHAQHRFLYGSDPAVLAHCNLAWVFWFMGYPDTAIKHSKTALKLAGEPEPHPHSQAFALSFAASLHQLRVEPREALKMANALIELSDRNNFPYWKAWGHVVGGWAKCAADRDSAGLSQIEQGVSAYLATESTLMLPYFLGLQSDASNLLGEYRFDLIDQALTHAQAGQISFYMPELCRLKAALLESADGPAEDRIAWLRRGSKLASKQTSRSLKLKILTSLCHQDLKPKAYVDTLRRLGRLVEEMDEGNKSHAMIEARNTLSLMRH